MVTRTMNKSTNQLTIPEPLPSATLESSPCNAFLTLSHYTQLHALYTTNPTQLQNAFEETYAQLYPHLTLHHFFIHLSSSLSVTGRGETPTYRCGTSQFTRMLRDASTYTLPPTLEQQFDRGYIPEIRIPHLTDTAHVNTPLTNALFGALFSYTFGSNAHVSFGMHLSSIVLDEETVFMLEGWGVRRREGGWKCVYSSKRDGGAWHTFINALTKRGALIVCVKVGDTTCGAYTRQTLFQKACFVEDGDAFLWRGKCGSVEVEKGMKENGEEEKGMKENGEEEKGMGVFKHTALNKNAVYFSNGNTHHPNGIGFGGQLGYFGMLIYQENVYFNPCSTFGCKRLCKDGKWTDIEVWETEEREVDDRLYEKGEGNIYGREDAKALLEVGGRKMWSSDLPDKPDASF